MEKAVIDGKVSFSRSGATSKNVNWLSLIVPKDAEIIKEYLQEHKDSKFVPKSLKQNKNIPQYYEDRYDSSIKWIEKNSHAVISNGPFYLQSYAPESRTITVKAFEDESYPFKIGKWSELENAQFPIIKKINMSKAVQHGKGIGVAVETEGADSVLYFLIDGKGKIQASEKLNVDDDTVSIEVSPDVAKNLQVGANSIKIFAISNSVLKPDFYESSFLVTEKNLELHNNIIKTEYDEGETEYSIWTIPIVSAIAIAIFLKIRYRSRP